MIFSSAHKVRLPAACVSVCVYSFYLDIIHAIKRVFLFENKIEPRPEEDKKNTERTKKIVYIYFFFR